MRKELNLFRFALRELRGSSSRLAFSVASLVLAAFCIGLLYSLMDGVNQSINQSSRDLLGADLQLQSPRPMLANSANEISRELTAQGAKQTEIMEFYTMLKNAKPVTDSLSSTLVRVIVVDGQYPLMGNINTKEVSAWEKLSSGDQPVVVAEDKLQQKLGIEAGQQVSLGDQKFAVISLFTPQAGTPSSSFGYGEKIYIHRKHLSATGLMGLGSRVRYKKQFLFEDSRSVEAIKDRYFEQALEENVTVTTYREGAASLRRFLNRLDSFLQWLSFIVLLMGALSLAASTRAFLKTRELQVAIYRSLGMLPAEVFRIYAYLSLTLGVLSGITGSLLGAGLPVLLAPLVNEVLAASLPVQLDFGFSMTGFSIGAALALLLTVVMNLQPISRTAAVSPMRVLKSSSEDSSLNQRWWTSMGAQMPVILLQVVLVVVTFSLLSRSGTLAAGLVFFSAVGIAIVCLVVFSVLLQKVAQKLVSKAASYPLKQGMANLNRPANQTRYVIVSLGLSIFLLSLLLIMESSLSNEFAIEEKEHRPNVFLIDVQPSQKDGVLTILTEEGVKEPRLLPMIPARLSKINGERTDYSKIEKNAVERSWDDRIRTREYMISYREEIDPSESVIAGQFWEKGSRSAEVSVEKEWARRANVNLDDTIEMDIAGIPILAKVTSIREVRWQAMSPNSILLFSPSLLEKAPGNYIGSMFVPTERKISLQNRLLESYPNVSFLDVSEAVVYLQSVVQKISFAIQLLVGAAFIAGTLVLLSSLRSSRFAREREAMLLKILGAGQGQLRIILMSEQVFLAVLSVGSGYLLAEVLCRVLIPNLMESAVVVPYGLVMPLLVIAVMLNIVMSGLLSREIFRAKPLELIRSV